MYDSLGFLSPVIFCLKWFMQQLWLLKVYWDDPVAVVFEAIGYIIKLYHHRQHKKYTVRDSIKEVV